MKKHIAEQSKTQMQRTEIWWRRAVTVFLVATASVLLNAYQSTLAQVVGPFFSDMFSRIEDHVRPMPDNKSIGISLRFWDPRGVGEKESFESMSIIVGPKQCRRSGGYKLTKIFGAQDFNHYTKAFVHITCRASGRVTVALTPINGTTTTVFDSRATDWEQLPFPGVKGSYSYGDVIVTALNRAPPNGPLEPVNKCILTSTCEAEFTNILKDIHRQ